MASNQARLVKRIIEKGNRHYTFGVFDKTHHGARQLTAVVEGTFKDAIKLVASERTESGHSVKGFKKLKVADVS